MRKPLLFVVCLPVVFAAGLRPQRAAASCIVERGAYRCDWEAFHAQFAAAHTIRIEAEPLDRSTATQLRHLVQGLGKNVTDAQSSGDLIFRVAPASPSGVAIGPSDQPLASLQVYARGPEGGQGALLWVETYIGQADRPYPMVVTSLTDQFERRFHQHGR